MFAIGEEPEKAEFLTQISLVNFEEANKRKVIAEMKDNYIGKVGTAGRDAYEYELRMDVLGKMIKSAKRYEKSTLYYRSN